jgi:NADPH-dependent ferric siderophore reductase
MPEPRPLSLVIASVKDRTPHMRRIRLTGALEGFEYLPGQDLAVAVLRDDGSMVRRRYTIRQFDPARRLLDLEVVMHGDGPGIRWAQAARPGVAVDAIGPRGKITLAPGAEWHLFGGDATALPGAFAMMEALPAGVPASAFLLVDGPTERQSIASGATDKTINWQYDNAPPSRLDGGLVAALSSTNLPPGRGHAYLAGEVALVSALKASLLARGWTVEQISAKAYWNRGRANAGHGEPELKAT